MIMIKGEYIPSEEEIKQLENWVQYQCDTGLPEFKYGPDDKLWSTNKEALAGLFPFADIIIGNPTTFYQSKYFNFYLQTNKGSTCPHLKCFPSEKDFQKFIKTSRYLIYRCIMGSKKNSKGQQFFAVYYHKDFGKISWFKNKIQFWINNRSVSNSFVYWLYNIQKFNFPNIHVSLTSRCDTK